MHKPVKPEAHQSMTFFDWIGVTAHPQWMQAPKFGAVVGMVLALIYFGTVAAALNVVFRTFNLTVEAASVGPNLGAGALIAAILSAPFVVWRANVAQRTVDLQHQGQITDRISKAVEQLGAEKTVKLPVTKADGKESTTEATVPNIEVRIGGIYALERIAQDSMTSDQGRDHIRIMEILCAYVRENAPAAKAQDHDFGAGVPLKDDATADERSAHFASRKERLGSIEMFEQVYQWVKTLPPPRTDIQTAIEVIGRRNPAQIALERDTPSRGSAHGYRLDLRATCLQRADMSALAFDHAIFSSARLQGADLSVAQIEGANLREAQMQGANLGEARMQKANLSGAQMQRANLSGADLTAAHLGNWTLARASLRSADFTDATGLWEDDLTTAYGDSGTILPPGLVRPAHWNSATLDPWSYSDPEYGAWLATLAPEPAPD